MTRTITRDDAGDPSGRLSGESVISRIQVVTQPTSPVTDERYPLWDPAPWAGPGPLANGHELRAYDAMQLAVVIALNRLAGGGIVLVSADRELNDAAATGGFAVENPNSPR